MHVDLLCVGRASYDLVFSVERNPGDDEKCIASGFVSSGGGPAANGAVTAARLGGTAAFAGYLGNDAFGVLHFEELRSEGVETRLIARGPHPTPLSAILVKPDGKRSVVAHQQETPAVRPDAVDFSEVRPRALLFDGHEPALSLSVLDDPRLTELPTVLDAGSVHKGTLALARRCRYLVASEKFARDFSGETDRSRALRVLAEIAPVAVVTLGADGLIWASGMDSGAIPAFRVASVDTTGAGDAFHGAFALRMALGDGLTAALRYASGVAALKCTKPGARRGIPVKVEVERFLESSVGGE
ncbi:MAG: PfkB family carbohydrate kinase [Desulfobacteraceae bacterium]|nr:PfkB family carbohydrate kinase [Desulfobacteraceae bacterium]